jgi:predicted PurR-regulated permease PerM
MIIAEKNTNKTTLYILGGLLLLASAYFLYLLSDIVIVLIISILISFIFNPFVVALEKTGINRLNSVLLVFFSIGFILYLVLSFIIPKFIFQMNELLESLKTYSLHDQIIKIENDVHKFLPFFNPGELSAKLEGFISGQILNSFDFITPFVSSLVSLIAIMVIIPFITFFILKDSSRIMHSIINLLPNRYFEMSYWIIKRVTLQLGNYVRAWIFDASFVGITLGFGLYLLGIQYSLPLGVIAGAGHLIPYFGPVIGGVPAIIISIIQFGDLSMVPFIILLILIIYTLDNGFVQPYIFSKSLGIHPILIILLIVAGGQLFGFLGMMLIIPATTVIKTAVKEIYFALKNYNIARL